MAHKRSAAVIAETSAAAQKKDAAHGALAQIAAIRDRTGGGLPEAKTDIKDLAAVVRHLIVINAGNGA